MWSSLAEYHRPTTVREALRLLARPSPRTVPLAGGTRLVAERDPAVEAVVDLGGLDLAFVEPRGHHLRLGAMTNLQALVTGPKTRTLAHGLLAEAACHNVPRALRNVATLGGTLAAGGPTCELALALLVLDARLVIRARTRRTVSLEAFLSNRAEYLSPASIIVEIRLPMPPTDVGAALAKVSLTPRDRPIANAAAFVSRRNGICHGARLALGGVAPDPIRLPAIEAMLSGSALEDDLLTRMAQATATAINPPADSRASADYRREMAGVVTVRALREAWQQVR